MEHIFEMVPCYISMLYVGPQACLCVSLSSIQTFRVCRRSPPV